MTRALALLAGVLLVVAAVVGLSGNSPPDEVVLAIVFAGLPTALGLRIESALPGHGVGRRLGLVGVALAVMAFTDALRVADADPAAAATRWGALLDDTTFVLVFVALASVIAVFPSGRAATPRAARAERLAFLAAAVVYVLSLFRGAELLVDGRAVDPPLPTVEPLQWVTLVVMLGLFAWLISVVAGVRGRYRRARGVERLQLRWLAYAAALVPLAIVLCVIDGALVPGEWLTVAAFASAAIGLPIAITVAVLRYRLYEIDRLINRTLVYTTLTVVLAAAYAAVVLLVGVAVGRGSSWAVAGATLVVAVLFRPVRDHSQRAVDRRFARRRYEGLRRVETFLEAVRSGREEPERLGPALAQALGDDGLEVYFQLPATGGYADAAGRMGDPPVDTVRARSTVRRGDLELGVVLHDPALELQPDALGSVLRAAVLPMELARLRVEVRVQLAEVEASRARLVAAAEAERRKLERDIHDGAQQRLVALGLALRHAQHQLDGDPDGALRTLDDAVGEIAAAVAELREIARGLRPGLLDAGLGPALAGVAERSPVPIALEVAPGRLPSDVEAAAFYLACEAVTNAVKHAGARRIRLRVDATGGGVRVEVADDGIGGARTVPGGGIAGMAERAAARGGVVHVESPVGGGTRIVAELPA